MNQLSKLKCEACSGDTPKLNSIEIQENIKKINNWTLNNDKEMIFKKFLFKSFKKALKFTNEVGQLAETESHHPDISLGFGYCLIMLHTHKIKSLSKNDFILAAKIDELLNKHL